MFHATERIAEGKYIDKAGIDDSRAPATGREEDEVRTSAKTHFWLIWLYLAYKSNKPNKPNSQTADFEAK